MRPFLIFGLAVASCIGCVHEWRPTSVMTAPRTAEARIRKSIPGVSLVPASMMTLAQLAGRYSCPGATLEARGSGWTAGWDLYLSQDGNYMYAEWSDITSSSTNEMGQWDIEEGFIVLTPEWVRFGESQSLEDHRFLVLSLKGAAGILLMGTRYDYSYYLDHVNDASGDAEVSFLIRTAERVQASGASLGKRQMR